MSEELVPTVSGGVDGVCSNNSGLTLYGARLNTTSPEAP